MKIAVQKQERKKIISNSRFRLKSSGAREEINPIHEGIMDDLYNVEFVTTDSSVGEISNIIEVQLIENRDDAVSFTQDEEEASIDALEDFAKQADGAEVIFNDTNFIAPVNYEDLSLYETVSQIPTYKVNSFVNYYDPLIEDAFMNGVLPNIYRETIAKPLTTQQALKTRIRTNLAESNASRTVIFDHKMNLGIVNSQKEKYPCFSEIVISKNDNNLFTDILKNLDLFNFFINDVKDRLTKPITFTNDSLSVEGDDTFNSNFLRYLVANISSDNLDEEVILSNRDDDLSRPINFLDKLEAIGLLLRGSISNSNFKSILQNKSVPNETVFYKIEKFPGKSSTNPLKTFYVPSDGNFTDFIDTEVAYNTEYSYKVSAFVIVYGTRLSYSYISFDKDTKKAKFKVVSTPTPSMFEIDLFTKNLTPATTPPLTPSVKFINESSSESSIKIAFSLRTGREKDHFIKILPTDNYIFRKEIGSDLVTFRRLDEPIQIEIMRMETKPKSIFQFENAEIVVIRDTDQLSNLDLMVHKEVVFPNKKYYYVFRTLSASGMVSNPSPVYEVELIKTADQSRINSKIIKLEEDQPLESSYIMRKLLQIRPSLKQAILNKGKVNDDLLDAPISDVPVAPNILSRYAVGESEHSIWGRKFKIRIKSNESGKIIDINVNFDLIKDEKVEDL